MVRQEIDKRPKAAGNFLAEIQETSDITYRVYDFGRKDVHGNPRELHIEEAKAAIDYQVWPTPELLFLLPSLDNVHNGTDPVGLTGGQIRCEVLIQKSKEHRN